MDDLKAQILKLAADIEALEKRVATLEDAARGHSWAIEAAEG